MRYQRLGALAVLMTAMMLPVRAHHGVSNWDLNKDITLAGTLSGVELINPHAWLKLDVRGSDGRPEPWRCEMRSASCCAKRSCSRAAASASLNRVRRPTNHLVNRASTALTPSWRRPKLSLRRIQ